MKKSILLATTMFMLSCGSNEVMTQDGRYKGAVKSAVTTEYSAHESFGEIVSGRINSIIKRGYNRDGYITSYYSEKNGEQSLNIEYTYNSDNKVLKLENTSKTNFPDYREIYEYNSNGDEVSCKKWNIDRTYEELFSHTIHEYDKDNNCVSENTYNPDGSVYEKILSEYKDGVCIKSTTYEDGVMTNVVTYDEKSGNVLNKKSFIADIPSYLTKNQYLDFETVYDYDKGGKLISYTTFSYNSPGDALLVNRNYPQGSLLHSKSICFVDENGLDVKEEYTRYEGWSDPEIDWTALRTSTYDEHQSLIEQETKYSFRDEPALLKCTYEYDDHGNWIKKSSVNSADSDENYIITRAITYYE